jgi:alpha,alpha-trehalase
MLDSDPAFRPIGRLDGYLPIEDHGLIGDGSTCALVGRDGAVGFLCVPRFDDEALFCSVLGHENGGEFTVAPTDLHESRQRYDGDTGILITEMRGPDGTIRVTDLLTVRNGADLTEDVPAARGELLRRVEVLDGEPTLRVTLEPRNGGSAERLGGGMKVLCAGRPELELHLHANRGLEGLRSELTLAPGERPLAMVLRWGHTSSRYQTVDAEERIEAARGAWRRWLGSFSYDGPREALVRRSAITLKMLDHFENGAIVAAATSSLPEEVGGVRNWDYRYAWIRDCAFSVYALRRIGFTHEADAFLAWALDAAEREGAPRIMYDLDGKMPPEEWEDEELEGYRASPPVRWGNAAAHQVQHDVYGEMLDCAYQWGAGGGGFDPHLWECLRAYADAARDRWRDPDHGIWEVRTPGRTFTYSVAMCQVALDRAARLAERHGLDGDIGGWKREAETIRRAILEDSWDEETGSITEHLGDEPGGLDASLLTLPLRRVVPADHPRMVATVDAVADRLGAGEGLLYRYLPDESPDGLPGHEGAFLLCSFWWVDNLAHQGRLEEARELYGSLCDRANPLGLLSEQIDPPSGRFLGNFPQAFSHVGVIASGINIARREAQREGDP